MKKKILFFAFAALALVACGDRNEPTNENKIPAGQANDMGCDINILQSATTIIEKSEQDAVSYLLASGWMEIEDTNASYVRTFICKDSTLVLERAIFWVPGPRTKMQVSSNNGVVSSTKVECFCYSSENPFHHMAEWDAWINNDWNQYDYWNVNVTVSGTMHRYTDFESKDHEKFFKEIKEFNEADITSMTIRYGATYNLAVIGNRIQDMVQITMTVGKYEN